ncbi:MAG: hypothetical protein AB8G77_15905 [Rhodothermales bacterium]
MANSTLELDGEALFKGIMMGAGEFAETLPIIRDTYYLGNALGEEELVSSTLFTQLIVDKMDANDPEFFDNFEQSIKSGDHLVILDAMHESGVMMLDAILDMPETDSLLSDAVEDKAFMNELTDAINANVEKEIQLEVDEVRNIIADFLAQGEEANKNGDDNALRQNNSIQGTFIAIACIYTIAAFVNYAAAIHAGVAIWVALAFAGAAAVAVALTAAAAVWNASGGGEEAKEDPTPQGSGKSNLLEEQLIHSLAEYFNG